MPKRQKIFLRNTRRPQNVNQLEDSLQMGQIPFGTIGLRCARLPNCPCSYPSFCLSPFFGTALLDAVGVHAWTCVGLAACFRLAKVRLLHCSLNPNNRKSKRRAHISYGLLESSQTGVSWLLQRAHRVVRSIVFGPKKPPKQPNFPSC